MLFDGTDRDERGWGPIEAFLSDTRGQFFLPQPFVPRSGLVAVVGYYMWSLLWDWFLSTPVTAYIAALGLP
jgi:hypothetical protein